MISKLFEQAKIAAFDVLPSTVNPENQYAKSFAAVLCLIVSADFEFDAKEFKDASQFIEQDNFLRREGLTRRTLNYFKAYCETIKKVMKEDSIEFAGMQTTMIAEARDVPEEYEAMLGMLINQLIPICTLQEQEVLRRIAL